MNAPRVTIIMPLHNAAPFVSETIASLRAQTFADFELLVIDDGSTDEGPAVVRNFGDRRIRIFTTDKNTGPAGARNLGLDSALGAFIAFADADDIAQPHRLATQLGVLDREPALGFIGSRVEVIDTTGAPTGELWGYTGPDEQLAPTLLFRNVLATSTLLFRREVIGSARFRTDLPVASDYELWARLARTSIGRVLPDPLVKYRVHAANLTHCKQALAEDCLREIAALQLRVLGIEPTADDITLHRQLATRHECSPEFVERAEKWLLCLRCAGGARLDPVVVATWDDVCRAAAGLGWWTLRKHRASPLSAGRARGLAWRVLRAELKRRFPALARAAKGERI